MYCVHTLLNIIHSRQFKSCCHCTISISPMTPLCRLVWQKQPDLLIRKIKQLWETKRTNRCFSGTQDDPLQGAHEPQWCKIERMKRVHVCVCVCPHRPWRSDCISILFSLHCWKVWVVIQRCRTILHPFSLCIDTPSHDITTWCFAFWLLFLGLRKPCFFPSL